jgi:uncharacterized repeat protein (TIGR01451 family)
MPKPKNNLGKDNNDLKVKNADSSVGEFVKRSLPCEEDAEKFDEFVKVEAHEGDMEESLSEIYQDDNGKMVNVRKLDIKKKRGFFFWLFSLIFFAAVLAGAAYGFYYFYLSKTGGNGAVEFSINGKNEVLAGEEFSYAVNYKNLSSSSLTGIEIKLVYPENFIFSDSEPKPDAGKDLWRLSDLGARGGGEIKIKGKIIAEKGSSNIILGSMNYRQANFSSEFKKENSFETLIRDTGIKIIRESDSGILAGETNIIKIKYSAVKEGFLKNFRVMAEAKDNVEFIEGDKKQPKQPIWTIGEVKEEEGGLDIKFKVKEKKEQNEEIKLTFENSPDGNVYYKFLEERVSFEVIKNTLNLNLILNGSRVDQGVDFGQTLNYSVVYSNKGETEMKDVVIMAVLSSEILDWQNLNNPSNGNVSDKTITWTKAELPSLEILKPGDEGIIDFSLNVLPLDKVEIVPGDKYQVESYAQFSIGNMEIKENEDAKSNTIISKINSDLELDEQVRYFNEDNIAVGSGPLPPKVGQTTSYKVYWVLTNNLHELNELTVEVPFPAYVKWDEKSRATVGNLYYDSGSNKAVWNIGRLPIDVYKVEAEFNISITPSDADADKVLVLLPGSKIRAVDSETGAAINKTGQAKTTRLEDDDIAQTDGRVVR